MLIYCSVIASSDGGVTKAVNKRHHYVGVASLSVFGGNFVLHGQGTSGPDQCPLFGVERCPLLGGSKCISSMVKSIGGKLAVRCREVVRFSEGPLLEVLLYFFN